MAFADEAEAVEDVGHAQRDSCFAGARIAREGHVQSGWLTREAEFPAYAFHEQERGDLTNAGLDGSQADEFVIELRQDVFDSSFCQFCLEIDHLGLRLSASRFPGRHGHCKRTSATRPFPEDRVRIPRVMQDWSRIGL